VTLKSRENNSWLFFFLNFAFTFFSRCITIANMKKLKAKIQVLLLIFLIFLIAYWTIFGDNGILKLRKIEQENEQVKVASEKIKAENERLKKEITLLREDRKYVEKVAREELGMTRKDEIIFKKKQDDGKEKK
jgi:cell division protein FtsB